MTTYASSNSAINSFCAILNVNADITPINNIEVAEINRGR